MNIEALRYAQTVSRTKSFSAAARAYGVTQPALSSGVARLEEELGVKLFDRSPRGVRPTEHGARILPLIDHVLNSLDTLAAEAQRLASPVTETIRMGVSPLIGADLVARAFRAARTLKRPRDLVLREADLDPLRADLEAGRLDIVLVPAVPGMPTLRHRVIAREPVVVIDPDASGDDSPVELKAVADAAYILGPPTCGLTTYTTQLFHGHDLALRTYPGEAASFRAVDEWAAMGLGAALLPRSKITHEHTSCRPLLQAGTPVEIAYEAVWDCDTPLGADLEEMVTALTVTEEAPPVGSDTASRGAGD
ncbi:MULTISPECIES: LysR family transcriptional regulator [Streptomyces]|uniref:LysR family transcriptional regulator n=1 Tax=Streptomyces pratisoli TaxID=3139917 RepID=A0ACC6QUZ9_9ACTN|nr:LysR family transcriptional regulator [Streptomyces sp. NBC_00259]